MQWTEHHWEWDRNGIGMGLTNDSQWDVYNQSYFISHSLNNKIILQILSYFLPYFLLRSCNLLYPSF